MKMNQSVLLCMLLSFSSVGCIGLIKQHPMTETGQVLKIGEKDRIALLVPVTKGVVEQGHGTVVHENGAIISSIIEDEPTLLGSATPIHGLDRVADIRQKFGIDVIYYAENFSSKDADAAENKIANISVADGKLHFKKFTPVRHYTRKMDTSSHQFEEIVNVPDKDRSLFNKSDRIYELKDLPLDYDYFIKISESFPCPEERADFYEFLVVLTVGCVPYYTKFEYAPCLTVTDAKLQVVKTYSQVSTRQVILWLPFILTLGVYENVINQPDVFSAFFEEATGKVVRGGEVR